MLTRGLERRCMVNEKREGHLAFLWLVSVPKHIRLNSVKPACFGFHQEIRPHLQKKAREFSFSNEWVSAAIK
jgi:hypothetical protein